MTKKKEKKKVNKPKGKGVLRHFKRYNSNILHYFLQEIYLMM